MFFWLSNHFSWKNSLVLKSIAFSRSMIHSIDFEMSSYTFTNEIIFSSEFNIVRFQSMAYFETPCKSHLLCLKSCCWRLQKIHHCLLTHIPIFSFNSCSRLFHWSSSTSPLWRQIQIIPKLKCHWISDQTYDRVQHYQT